MAKASTKLYTKSLTSRTKFPQRLSYETAPAAAAAVPAVEPTIVLPPLLLLLLQLPLFPVFDMPCR